MKAENFKTLMSCITFMVIAVCIAFTISWINTPTEFSTFHYVNLYADNETKESLNAIARISESQDQQCIVKEYVEINTSMGLTPIMFNEYMTENCSYTQQR